MKKYYFKNKKGFTFAQVLLYAMLAIIIFSSFFSLVATSRGANLSYLDKNDILYQVYNLDDLLNSIKYATDITYICDSTDTTCDNTKIRLTNKDGLYDKEYAFLNNQIVLTNNINTQIPQYYDIQSVTFKKITNAVSNIRVIEVNVNYIKNKSTYQYKVEIFPNAWLYKTVGVDL
jgi:hypothetical protein